jgi:hypothetical protein
MLWIRLRWKVRVELAKRHAELNGHNAASGNEDDIFIA